MIVDVVFKKNLYVLIYMTMLVFKCADHVLIIL